MYRNVLKFLQSTLLLHVMMVCALYICTRTKAEASPAVDATVNFVFVFHYGSTVKHKAQEGQGLATAFRFCIASIVNSQHGNFNIVIGVYADQLKYSRQVLATEQVHIHFLPVRPTIPNRTLTWVEHTSLLQSETLAKLKGSRNVC
jgi:hypothetical protein